MREFWIALLGASTLLWVSGWYGDSNICLVFYLNAYSFIINLFLIVTLNNIKFSHDEENIFNPFKTTSGVLFFINTLITNFIKSSTLLNRIFLSLDIIIR